jgi:hypothetical protein
MMKIVALASAIVAMIAGQGAQAQPAAFRTRDGKIFAPDHSEFVARGINIRPEDMVTVARTVTTLFPGINFIRLAIDNGTYPKPASLESFVTQMTSQHIVVEIEDHPWPSPGTYKGVKLEAESKWYASLADAFKDNPYVWFGTMNEPSATPYGPALAAITVQEVATYEAIRGTGSQAIILLQLNGGGNPGSVGAAFGMTASAYSKMANIVWDVHYYGWGSKFSTDPAAVTEALMGSAKGGYGIEAAQTIRGGDGIVPVIIGEFGDSTDGTKIDANGWQVIEAVLKSGYGFAAWAWESASAGDRLTLHGQLTPFGHRVAAGIAAAATEERLRRIRTHASD